MTVPVGYVYCSNCGRQFYIRGQRHGFSHCDLHEKHTPLSSVNEVFPGDRVCGCGHREHRHGPDGCRVYIRYEVGLHPFGGVPKCRCREYIEAPE